MPIITNLERNFKNPKKTSNSKKIGIILLVVATIGYIGLFIRWIPFLHQFLVGTFGLFSYALFLIMYVIGGAMAKGAKYVYSKKYIFYLCLALFSLLAIFHISFTFSLELTYGEYLGEIYTSGLSVGGVLMGLVMYPLQKLLSSIGAIFLFIIILALSIWLIYDYLTRVRYIKQTDTKIFNSKVEKIKRENNATVSFELKHKDQTKIGLDAQIESEQQKRDEVVNQLGLNESIKNEHFVENKQLNNFANDFLNEKESPIFDNNVNTQKSTKLEPPTNYSGSFGYNLMNTQPKKKQSSNYDKNKEFLEMTMQGANFTPKINQEEYKQNLNTINEPIKQTKPISVNEFLDANFGNYQKKEEPKQNINEFSNDYQTISQTPIASSNEQENTEQTNINEENNNQPNDLFNQKIEPEEEIKETSQSEKIQNAVDDIDINKLEDIDLKNFELPKSLILPNENSRRNRGLKHNDNQTSLFSTQTVSEQKEEKKKPHTWKKYVFPTVDLLTNITTDASQYNENCEINGRAIETTLNNFGIPAKVINTVVGPAVTRYELDMPAGISVNKVNNFANDIAMAVASKHGVRIQAPIPGKSAVGVEIPNNKVATVGFREIIESNDFKYSKCKVAYVLGKEVSGQKVIADMDEMPHMLVAGSTGSGKSVALNTMIISMLYKYSPEDLRLILVDPKQVEFFVFNGLPHLLTPEVIVDPLKALNALTWSIDEMERRYTEFREHGVKKIEEYNNLPEVKSHEKEKMPQIVIIVDEVGDIMAIPQVKKDFEEKVRRLTQKARAAGMHLVLATQRPSVDVITGVIKANLPSRMAFAVTNFQDSKTILDKGGADKLLGKGDMLFSPQGTEPVRVQGCYISNEDINNVVNFIKEHNESYFDDEINKSINKEDEPSIDDNSGDVDSDTGFDPLMADCLKLVIKNGCASASMLQRRFSIGNPKAARIIDQMEQAKFIGPMNGSKPRTVYITAEQFKELFGEGIDD